LDLVVEHDGVGTTVLIVDDHAGFRHGAREMLESDGFVVIAEAESLASARTALGHISADLVLLDIRLPDGSGFELAEELARLPGSPNIVLTSSRDAQDYGDRLSTCGARGFIPKHRLTPAGLRSFT
jgi:DNA-binding NarL/FixJ family response regulator